MSKVTITPVIDLAAEKVSKRVYRKQILPLGSIDYKGRKITFDKKYLTDLANSFKKGAYDQVPFVFADADNRHNMDPEKFRGEITALELAADGLDMVVSVTPAGAKAIKSNPRLGVSARIVEGLAKSDGRSFPRAIQHVLATMDPRVTGLRPWKTVDLSEDDAALEVTDLSTETITREPKMGKKQRKQGTDSGPLDLSSLTDEEFSALLDLTDGDEDDDTETGGEEIVKPVVVEDDTDDEDATIGEDDEDEDDDESDEDDESDDGEGETDTAIVDDADDEPKKKVKKGKGKTDLSNTLTNDSISQVREMREQLAADRWKAERRELVRDGVPPHLLDLAAPILSSPDTAIIDLSGNDEGVDATAIIRGLLQKSKGTIDLSPEVGHGIDLSEDDDKDADSDLLSQWQSEYGDI